MTSDPKPRLHGRLAKHRAYASGRTVSWLAAGLLAGSAAQGQEAVEVLRTGDNPPLSTLVRSVNINDEFGLTFTFGFATDETADIDTIPDSVTATLQATGDPASTLIVATLDASGAIWAPISPGTLTLSPDSVVRVPIDFPSLVPMLDRRNAFSVTVPLPFELQHREVNLYLDLFDNGNSMSSLAWLGSVQPIPEPVPVALLFTGASVWFVARRRRR